MFAEQILRYYLCPLVQKLVLLTVSPLQGMFIKGAINLPAHSFYQTLSTISQLLSPIPKVVFHCSGCSPTGRGPRAAGWYADSTAGKGISSEALVLDGGIIAWIEKYGNREDLVATA